MASLKERVVREHKLIEEVVDRYVNIVLVEYKKNPKKYKKHINDFISNVESHLLPHFEFEEKEVFPTLANHQIVEILVKEHKAIKKLINNVRSTKNLNEKINMIEKLSQIIRKHREIEDEKLIPLLE